MYEQQQTLVLPYSWPENIARRIRPKEAQTTVAVLPN